MRSRLFLSVLSGCLLAAGCSRNAEPKATRAVVKRSATVARPPATAGPDFSGPYAGGGEEADAGSGPVVRLEAITLTAPAAWARKRAESSFVAAEFTLTRAGGDEADGRLTVSVAGGSVEANVERWKGQFGGAPKDSKQEQFDAGGFPVTLVDLAGDFNDQRGPFAPAVSRPGYRMMAAIIPVNGQLHFVKAVGPQKTVETHADEFKAFVRSVRRTS